MNTAALGRRFFESTRGRIVSQLRRGQRTVEELAGAIGLTDNAVRNHLAALERDGLVRPDGVRRGGGAGKPAVLYELHPDAATFLSRAYPPVLSTVMDVLIDELPVERATEVVREVGRRLARRAGGRSAGDLPARVAAGAAVLEQLGGDVEVAHTGDTHRITGSGCPLSAVVCHRPEVCGAVEAMLEEVVGAPVRTRCEHGERPRCRFEVVPAA